MLVWVHLFVEWNKVDLEAFSEVCYIRRIIKGGKSFQMRAPEYQIECFPYCIVYDVQQIDLLQQPVESILDVNQVFC